MILAADFEQSTEISSDLINYPDLESLGLVTIECMNGRPLRPNAIQHVRKQRSLNKPFGLCEERWIQNESMIDFLDFLFDQETSVHSKLTKLVS